MEEPVLYFDYEGRQVFNTKVLRKIFNSIGNRPFVTLSVNGGRKTGKSLLVTRFLQHFLLLQYDNEDYEFVEDEVQWSNEPLESVSPNSQARLDVWSEPIFIRSKTSQSEIGIVLVRTYADFDPSTPVQHNSAVLGLSMLLSSLFILIVRKYISNEILRFFQYYINVGKSIFTKDDECLDKEEDQIEAEKFQRLLFLVKDMDLRAKDFAHGYHSKNCKPPVTAHSQANLFVQLFELEPSRQPLENQHTYQEIISAFDEVGVFALPPPDTIGGPYRRNREIINYMKIFMELLNSSITEENDLKKINGSIMTGFQFLKVIEHLERNSIFSSNSGKLCARNEFLGRFENRIAIVNAISQTSLVSLYVSTIMDFLLEGNDDLNPRDIGLIRKNLFEKMNSFLSICLDTYSRRLSQGGEELTTKNREALSEAIEAKMKIVLRWNELKLKSHKQIRTLSTEIKIVLDKIKRLKIELAESEGIFDQDIPKDQKFDQKILKQLPREKISDLIKEIEDAQAKEKMLTSQIASIEANSKKQLDKLLNIAKKVVIFY